MTLVLDGMPSSGGPRCLRGARGSPDLSGLASPAGWARQQLTDQRQNTYSSFTGGRSRCGSFSTGLVAVQAIGAGLRNS
jgi:hypothetical protein